jgi:hypothetical protein
MLVCLLGDATDTTGATPLGGGAVVSGTSTASALPSSSRVSLGQSLQLSRCLMQ